MTFTQIFLHSWLLIDHCHDKIVAMTLVVCSILRYLKVFNFYFCCIHVGCIVVLNSPYEIKIAILLLLAHNYCLWGRNYICQHIVMLLITWKIVMLIILMVSAKGAWQWNFKKGRIIHEVFWNIARETLSKNFAKNILDWLYSHSCLLDCQERHMDSACTLISCNLKKPSLTKQYELFSMNSQTLYWYCLLDRVEFCLSQWHQNICNIWWMLR